MHLVASIRLSVRMFVSALTANQQSTNTLRFGAKNAITIVIDLSVCL